MVELITAGSIGGVTSRVLFRRVWYSSFGTLGDDSTSLAVNNLLYLESTIESLMETMFVQSIPKQVYERPTVVPDQCPSTLLFARSQPCAGSECAFLLRLFCSVRVNLLNSCLRVTEQDLLYLESAR